MMYEDNQLKISEYSKLYDILIPRDHLFRQINDLVDFTFVYDWIGDTYSWGMGRNSEDPIRLLKYLMLKPMYKLSDADLVERSRYDMSFKYFLGYSPEDDVICSSTLTKFRKLRLVNEESLNALLSKSVELAINAGVIKSKGIIVDSTHTQSRFRHLNPVEALRNTAKNLRRAVYEIDESMKEKMPAKPSGFHLEKEIAYCKELLTVIENEERLNALSGIKEKCNYLSEMVTDNLEEMSCSKDEDARIGHKTAETSFYGYKHHIAMTEEGIITAVKVTSGDKVDGPELIELIKTTKQNGVEVEQVIGDTAYSLKENLDYSDENGIQLVSKLHPLVSRGTRKGEDQFLYNKDAKMFVCPEGHMATKKYRRHNKQEHRKENPRMVYEFDIEKCKNCPRREGCYKEGAKSKSYSVSITSETQSKQKAFQESDEFKLHYRKRYKIEQKNADLKNNHGLNRAESSGIHAMKIQGITALFFENIHQIIKLKGK